MDDFARDMTSALYGNPHSASWPSQQSTARIENVRLRLLSFFKADPSEFDLVFVANATAGVKLVVEALRSLPQGFTYAYHEACHTSLVGVREEARDSACLDDPALQSWLEGGCLIEPNCQPASATLVAYPGQSHMDGRRYPLSWSGELRKRRPVASPRVYTLLDAASLAATSPLDLCDPENAPDFTVLSLYKIFGFPDLGALIVRRFAESVFSHRKYFGGGTVDMVLCGKEQWHAAKSQFLHERLEDGTLPFHSIIALDIAMTTHEKLFGTMKQVSAHTSYLTRRLLGGLSRLRHGNGQPVCVLYTDATADFGCGPVVSFNIKNSAGAWISLTEFDKLATLKKMHVRTGGLCSPGGIAAALKLEPWQMKNNFSAGFRCGTDSDIMAGKPTGVIRASLGAVSTSSDVSRFVEFVEEFFAETDPVPPRMPSLPTASTPKTAKLEVQAITVFPIKSCGGLQVPKGASWEVRPEGLAWDREWCLVHRGSGQALSQKRYPQMALLRPSIDFNKGVLLVEWRGGPSKTGAASHITVPLSANPALFDTTRRQMPSRVCGDEISPHVYSSPEINDFFTDALGIPCVLTRFPPGGRGLGSRSTKARMQIYQQGAVKTQRVFPGAFPEIPSPPESDSEQPREGKILLSNESPILLIHAASVDALNREIESRGGSPVNGAAFRANIIVRPAATQDKDETPLAPYSEDAWRSIRIGAHDFKLLGACRRCQMVCVDQDTGEKKQEPFTTLAKTRRFDGGKVYFGCHMCHRPPRAERQSGETQCPTIQVGNPVVVDADG
jgi:molybdenum cofactor sulfurtransferase